MLFWFGVCEEGGVGLSDGRGGVRYGTVKDACIIVKETIYPSSIFFMSSVATELPIRAHLMMSEALATRKVIHAPEST